MIRTRERLRGIYIFPIPPQGFLFLINLDGSYLTDLDGSYLDENR